MGYVRTDGDLTHLRGYGTQGAVPIEGIGIVLCSSKNDAMMKFTVLNDCE